MSAEFTGSAGQITATVTITRAATGKQETYTLTGAVSKEQLEAAMAAQAAANNAAAVPVSDEGGSSADGK